MTNDMKTCNNGVLMMVMGRNMYIYGVFIILLYFLWFSLIFMNIQLDDLHI